MEKIETFRTKKHTSTWRMKVKFTESGKKKHSSKVHSHRRTVFVYLYKYNKSIKKIVISGIWIRGLLGIKQISEWTYWKEKRDSVCISNNKHWYRGFKVWIGV